MEINKKKFKVGIIGLGIGKKHFECFQKNRYTEVTAICDFNTKKLLNYSKDIKIYNEAKNLIEDKNIDIVSICSNDNYHYSHILDCIKNKKHIFCEKPICLTLNEFSKLEKKIKNYKGFLDTNFNLRTVPAFNKLKEKIKKNKIGKIFSIEGGYESGRLYKVTQGWRGKIKNYSLTMGGMIHMLDLIIWLLNFFSYKGSIKVNTIGNNIASQKSNFKKDDNIVSIFKLRKITIILKASLGCFTPHFHTLRCYGTKGTFINDFRYKGYFEKNKFNFNREKAHYPGKYKNKIIDEFILRIKKNDRKQNSQVKNQILKVTKISLIIQKSLTENKTISANV